MQIGQLIVFKGMLIGIYKSSDLFNKKHFGLIFSKNFTQQSQIQQEIENKDFMVNDDLTRFHTADLRRFHTAITAILKQAGSSRYGKEDPGYLRRRLQMIFSTFFFLNFAKKTQDI